MVKQIENSLPSALPPHPHLVLGETDNRQVKVTRDVQ